MRGVVPVAIIVPVLVDGWRIPVLYWNITSTIRRGTRITAVASLMTAAYQLSWKQTYYSCACRCTIDNSCILQCNGWVALDVVAHFEKKTKRELKPCTAAETGDVSSLRRDIFVSLHEINNNNNSTRSLNTTSDAYLDVQQYLVRVSAIAAAVDCCHVREEQQFTLQLTKKNACIVYAASR